MVVIVDDEQSSTERWPTGAGRQPPTIATPEKDLRSPANGQRIFGSSQNGQGTHYEANGDGSIGSGSFTSLRIG